ncbi:transposase, partial [Alicyclobacillus fructus]|uniref:transposase n=1 Tax=Alicyclobacillus fructus TaxID=2816082 RepID=UPI001A8ECAF8
QHERRAAKWARVQEVQQLYASGMSIRAIARQTGLSRQTVRTYLRWTDLPHISRPRRRTLLDAYKDEISQLLRQGYSGSQIFLHLQTKGYSGSRSTLTQYVANLRREGTNANPPRASQAQFRRRRMNPRHVARLLTRSSNELDDEDKQQIALIRDTVSGAHRVIELCQAFRELLNKHDAAGLERWVREARTSGIREIEQFSRGLVQDWQAVAAAVTEPWSNGQVEGQVNRLKMVKRQMYGRASFQLLRIRLLLA